MTLKSNDYVLRDTLAEKSLTSHLTRLAPIYARISRNISVLAPLKYASEQTRRYLDGADKDKKTTLIWYFLWIIAAVMVSRAPYAATSGFPDWSRWLMAISASLALTWLADWAITRPILKKKCDNDFRDDQAEIDKKFIKAKETGNQLISHRAEAEESVLMWAKPSYQYPKSVLLIVICVSLLLAEVAGSFFYIRLRGEILNLTTVIVPLLGICLTVLEGLYKGYEIDYPKARRKISNKYHQYVTKLEVENSEELAREMDEFYINEGLITFVIAHPNHTAEELQQEETRLRKQRRCGQLHKAFYELKEKCFAEVKQLREEEDALRCSIIDSGELEKVMAQKAQIVFEKYTLLLEPLEQEMDALNCPLEPPAWKVSKQISQGNQRNLPY